MREEHFHFRKRSGVYSADCAGATGASAVVSATGAASVWRRVHISSAVLLDSGSGTDQEYYGEGFRLLSESRNEGEQGSGANGQ